MQACDLDTQYCSVLVPGIMGAEIMYTCAQIPARCADTPSCECLNDDQGPCQCAEAQGFHYARPMAEEAFVAWLQTQAGAA